MPASQRLRMKYLNIYSFRFFTNVVNYIDEKEFVTLEELYVKMRKLKWNRGLPIHSRNQLQSILLKNLHSVVSNKEYTLIDKIHVNGRGKTTTLYSLKNNWSEALINYFNLLKEKGQRRGKYEVEE